MKKTLSFITLINGKKYKRYMKNLKDTIYEKLKVDDISFNKFPIDGTLEDIAEFLEEEGFQQVEYGYVKTAFNGARAKCFMIFTTTIRFADTSKKEVSKDNPIFYIDFEDKEDYSVFYCGNGLITDIVVNNKKEFLKELNKRFGWK